MTAAPLASRFATWRETDWRHGTRLAVAVVVAFTVSTLCRLPESFWAVMSALIVARPTAGSTLGAGWDRVRGTMSGTVIGLAGVWLHHVGAGSQMGTLAIIAVVAFLSAIVPAMRSAPISALIILNSGGIPGHSALDVAGLRAIEIAIGVVSGVAVSLAAFATHARERFVDASTDWLRESAAHAVDDLTCGPVAAAVRDARRERNRATLRKLAELAVGADREARWLARERPVDSKAIDHVGAARVMTRIASDVGSVVRAADCAPATLDADARRSLADAVDTALRATADALVGADGGSSGFAALRRWASPADTSSGWVAASAHLLLQDLRHLARVASRAEPRR